jgi:hypothetical protein
MVEVRMRWLSMAIMALMALATTAVLIPAANAQTCQQLWVERNQYYKNHGYCFKTQQAITYFGNGGCHIQDQNAVPLSPAERARVN